MDDETTPAVPAPRPLAATERFAKEVFETPVEDEVSESFLAYSLSVITSRAIPDVRDGLKPVQRRILYSLSEQNIRPTGPYKKCARVVGDAMGKYHPHGDSAIYEALVRMAQPWSLRVPLVDGHGNFGSLDDGPAASRYCVTGDTRVRLADGSSVRMADLVDSPPDSERDIDVTVLDWNGKPVHATKAFNSGVHPTIRITSSSGFSLQGSHNHPVLCLVLVDGVPTLRWLQLDEVSEGTVVCLARNAWIDTVPTARESLLGTLLGAWVSEGWASETRAGFNNTDWAFFDEVLFAYDTLVGGARYVYSRTTRRDRREIHELDVQNLEALRASPLAELVGTRSAEKFVPEAVWRGGMGVKRAFLMACFEGDGGPRTAGNSFTIHYSTYSERLARELQELLLEFGVLARRKRYRRPTGVWEHRLIISGLRNVRAFADRVGFLATKQAVLHDLISHAPVRPHRLSQDHVPYVRDFVMSSMPENRRGTGRSWLKNHNFDRVERWETERLRIIDRIKDAQVLATIMPLMDSGYRFEEITAVEHTAAEPVYSIRVDTHDHSFLAGGFVNHNTECRMDHAATEMIGELDEDAVDFRPNYDGTEREPEVLPARLPNLLVNGTTGIAVGMATNMAPHNISDVVAAALAVLADEDITLAALMKLMPGPDFPTGGIIVDAGGIREAYETGRGAFRVRARAEVGQVTPKRRGITITELPYTIGPERFIAKCKQLIQNRQLEGIADIKDLSDRKHGMRIVVECKAGVNPQAVLGELYQKTPLEEGFSINAVALVNGRPETLGIKRMLSLFLAHRLEVVRRRTEFRLRKAQERAHIVEGLVKALASIDEIVAAIKKSKDTETARNRLCKEFDLSEVQATHILEMPLRRLTALEVTKLKDELKALKETIKDLEDILANEQRRRDIVGEELTAMAERFGSPRRSKIIGAGDAELPQQALEIPDEPCDIIVNSAGLFAKVPVGKRKTKPTRADAAVLDASTSTRGQVRLLTDAGRLVAVDAVEVPEISGKLHGVPIGDVVDLDRGEKVVAMFGDLAGRTLCIATVNGAIKRIAADQLSARAAQVIGLKDGDKVAGACVLADDEEFVIVTSDAQLLRAKASTVRPQGRTGGGVAGIKLGEGARVITIGVAHGAVHTLTDGSRYKYTAVTEYPAKGRGTGGVRCMRMRAGETELIGAYVGEGDVLAVSARGTVTEIVTEPAKRDATGAELGDATSLAVWAMPRPA